MEITVIKRHGPTTWPVVEFRAEPDELRRVLDTYDADWHEIENYQPDTGAIQLDIVDEDYATVLGAAQALVLEANS